MNILKTFVILLIIISSGILSRKFNIFNKDAKKTLSSFIYYFALPCLFFVKISGIDLLKLNYFIFLLSGLPIIIIIFILFLLNIFRIIKKDVFIILGVTISFGSYAFFGAPFFESLYGEPGLDFLILQASFLGIIGIGLTIIFFEYAVQKQKGVQLFLKIIKNPLIISIFSGILFSLISIILPGILIILDVINSAFSTIGRAAGGIAIFTLGMFIYDNFSFKLIKKAWIYALIRVISLPVVTFILFLIFRNIPDSTKIYLILLTGIPGAVSIAVFAQKYEYKVQEFTGIVVMTSLLSFAALGILYFISLVFIA